MSRSRGHVRERSPGTWAVVLSVPDPDTHRRKRVWTTVKGVRADAQRELTRQLAALDSGAHVDPSTQTVGQYLDRWIAHVGSKVAPKTARRYEDLLRHHVIPRLGTTRLQRLSPLAVQELYDELERDGRLDGGGGLATQTVVHVHRVLHRALKQAVKWQQVTANVCEAVEPPKVTRREMATLSVEEANRLLDAVEGHRILAVPVMLALATGARRGEILALRWSDVDLDVGRVRIRRSLQVVDRQLSFKAPKSGKARTVDLPAYAVAALRRHRAAQAQQRLALGEAYDATADLVCALEDGSPVHPDTLSWAFRDLVGRLDVAQVTFHGLRHTHATLMLASGEHLKVVSERLGHSTIAITGDLYSHVTATMQQQAAQRLDALMGRPETVG